MLPIVLFLVLVPPSLFLKYIYTGPDTMDLAVLSSVAVCATIFISTTYLYRSGERFSKGTLDTVLAGPIAPTCSVYKASLTRRFSPAKPYLLAIIPSCPNPAIYHKFEWAPVSIAASPFAQPTCKATNIPPAVLTSLKSASLVLRRLKGSSNATVWFGVAIVTLISGVYLVGLEAVSWSGEIDEGHFAKSDMIKLPAVIDHQAQAVHVNIRHTIFPERTQRILELDVSTLEAPTLHTLTEDTPAKPKVECSPLQLDSTLEAPVPLTRGDDIPAKPKAEHLHLQLPKCRHVGGRRVPQARLLSSTSTRSPTTRKTARA